MQNANPAMLNSSGLFNRLRFKKTAASLVFLSLTLAILAVVLIFFPWNWVREPINRYVSGELGRRFAITQHLDIKLGRVITVQAQGVEFANPSWADEPFFLTANSAEFDVKWWPLFSGKLELPRIVLSQPNIQLQAESDGRKTWVLARDTSDKQAVPVIGSLVIDQGTIRYLEKMAKTDVTANVSLQGGQNSAAEKSGVLPLTYQATGIWKGTSFSANGRSGGVLQLAVDGVLPFPIEIDAKAGATQLKAQGTIANVALLGGIDANFDLQGKTLDDLFPLLGIALPSTPAYRLRGKLQKQGKIWAVGDLQGTLGSSDLAGSLQFDSSNAVPLLTGKLQSKVLDFKDLAPVIGVKATPDASPSVKAGKVLPVSPIDVSKLKSMDADVIYTALDVRHVEALPIDKGSAHIQLNSGVLQLNPLSVGVANGMVEGALRIDTNPKVATFATKLDIRGLQLQKILPTVQNTKSSLGAISGDIDLQGNGNSVAQMLGSATGNMAVLTGRGEISNILLEFLGLDGGEIIKFFLRGDKNVPLRCAALAFDVKQGLMTSRVLVLDTSDTVITGQGQISLANETLSIVLKPVPKDKSILSFKSPLAISGTFADPQAAPETSALAGRAAIALALGAINPLLALAATIETGSGKDVDCQAVLAQGRNSKAGKGNPAATVSK